MQLRTHRTTLSALLLLVVLFTTASAQQPHLNRPVSAIPTNVLLRIMRAEDERRWDQDLASLLADKSAPVRRRAALAMGRIGDDRAVPALVELFKTESDPDVRQMIAFAIGEIESPDGADALIEVLGDTRAPGEMRARAVEALGKIGGALLSSAPRDQTEPKPADERLTKIRTAILDALMFEGGRRSMPDRETILLGLTAVLRTKPEGAGLVIVRFLGYSDPRIVADALNTMARLRLKDGSEQVRQLLGSGDAVVRANAARVAGANEDKQAFDALLARALNDEDLRVRVSAIRALGSLKDPRATAPLLVVGQQVLNRYKTSQPANPEAANELLELAAALGRIEQSTDNKDVVHWLLSLREKQGATAPEIDSAFARVAPRSYFFAHGTSKWGPLFSTWREASAAAQALGEIAKADIKPDWIEYGTKNKFRDALDPALGCHARPQLSGSPDRRCLVVPGFAVPELLRAFVLFKPTNLEKMLRSYLNEKDVIIRATAAELLGEQPPNEANVRVLIDALRGALKDKDSNDAALAVLGALAKQKTKEANDAIKTALDSSDHLIRRRAVALLKANGVGDFSNRIGTVKTRNTDADYRRAIARIGKHVTATLVTSKGSFTIEFLPEDALLTVANFVQLARKGYFNGITFHRVVPNFVIQGGDPRGDGNGGPGYSIRCEINEEPFERAAVGMALSGKDTGGSQWFVTHSPQPHLDGGYTVFGRVIRGMDVVDNIARGDVIRRVIVSER